MKKFLCIALAIVMIICATACGADNKEAQEVKIGLVCLHDENSTYDANFINAFNEACAAKGVTPVIKTGIPESYEAYEASADLADSGCSLVFADSFGHEDYMVQAAQDYPDVEFCHATGTKAHTQGLTNFHNAFASIYEGRFLDGVAAGLKLSQMVEEGTITEAEAKVGYVGAHPYAEVISGYTSFYLGVRYICPSATMEVIYTDSWYDETLEKEAAVKLITDGCVLISGHADSMGAPTACEKSGVPFVFYNGDLSEACGTTFIISTRINWQPYFEYIIDCVLNGEEIATDWVGTIENGAVAMTDVNEAAAAPGTAEKLEEIKTALIDGEINVFDVTAFTVDGITLDSYMADVDTDESYESDTQVIIDGVFAESEFRSAPYFDIIIDGISMFGE